MFDETTSQADPSPEELPKVVAHQLDFQVLPWLSPVAEKSAQLRTMGLTLTGTKAARLTLARLAKNGHLGAAIVLGNLAPETDTERRLESSTCEGCYLALASGLAGLLLGWLAGAY